MHTKPNGTGVSTEVLIIGAGPTGLSMSVELSRYHIDHIIIDKNSGPSVKSKALGIQARTLELFRNTGIDQKLLALGKPLKQVNSFINKKKAATVPISKIGKGLSPYPYLFILEQSKTEQILISYLKSQDKEVCWENKLTSFEEKENYIEARIKAGEDEKTISAKYIIGADGAGSDVRHFLKLKFKGGTYEQQFFLADVSINWNLSDEELFLFLSEEELLAFFPLPGEKRVRVVGIVPPGLLNKENLSFDAIVPVIKKKLPDKVEFDIPEWFSIYKLHHRVVNEFRKGRSFLAGDAAHVHSPAGAQGMNTGVQDAINLAWKLAFVLKFNFSAKILDTYHAERFPFAQRLIKSTDQAFYVGVGGNFWLKKFRAFILPYFLKFIFYWNFTREFAFKTISQINLNYRKSALSTGRKIFFHPAPGDRAPYAEINLPENPGIKNTLDLFKKPGFHLLLFIRGQDNKKEFLMKRDTFFPVLQHRISFNEKSRNAFKIYGVKKEKWVLVRPDGYISCQGSFKQAEKLEEYFRKWIRL